MDEHHKSKIYNFLIATFSLLTLVVSNSGINILGREVIFRENSIEQFVPGKTELTKLTFSGKLALSYFYH